MPPYNKMGFLRFFVIRKPSSSNDDSHDDAALKAQSYDATVAACPPILGDYPVAGNGANFLATFQKTHPNANHFVLDSSAPPPLVPTAPPDSSERPRTAPSSPQVPNPSSGTGTEPKKARATRRHGPPYKLPPKIWSTSSAASAALAEPSTPFSPPPPPFAASERAASISSGCSKGFVDLLDAQWAIKPSDFRSRVQAAGARDYGEDVADRNLRENGFDLQSPKGQEVYLRNTGTLPTGAANDHAGDQSLRLNKRHSMGTSLRTASLNSDSYGVHLMKTSLEVSEQRWTSNNNNKTTSMMKRTSRRNSLHSYVSTTSSMLSAHEPLGRRKPQPLDFSSSPSMLQQKLRRLSELDLDVTTKEKLLGQPPQSPSVIEESPRQPGGQSPGVGLRHRRNASEQSTTSWEEASETARRATNRQTMHYVPGSFGARSPTKTPTKKQRRSSLHSVQSHSQQDRVRPSHKLIAYHEIAASSPTPASREIKTLPTQREDLGDEGRRARARSIASVSSKDARPHEIEEIVPERNSSLRNYSLSSETATYSSIGSSPFRPQSRHTPTTSVDLTPTMPFFNFSHPVQNNNTPIPSVGGGTPRKGQQHSRSLVPSSPAGTGGAKSLDQEHPAPILTIDDEYASSDDSFDHTWRPRGENEKDLLFVESGYGLNGSQLPGLPGLFDGAASSRPTTSSSAYMRRLSAFYDPASDASTDPEEDDDGAGGPDTVDVAAASHPGGRRRPSEPPRLRSSAAIGGSGGVISAAGSEAVHDESSDDDICFDIPRSRAAVATARYHKPPRAPSGPPRHEPAAAAGPRVKELYELPIADLAAIMRQRKMAKAKMREDGAAAARQQQQQTSSSPSSSTTDAAAAAATTTPAGPGESDVVVVEDEGPKDAAAAAATAAGPRGGDERLSGYVIDVER